MFARRDIQLENFGQKNLRVNRYLRVMVMGEEGDGEVNLHT